MGYGVLSEDGGEGQEVLMELRWPSTAVIELDGKRTWWKTPIELGYGQFFRFCRAQSGFRSTTTTRQACFSYQEYQIVD